MKNIYCICKNMAVAALFTVMLSSCGNGDSTIDYNQVYSKILDGYYSLLSNESYNEESLLNGELGVSGFAELCESSTEALSSVGYNISDLSGDGIPELLIGCISGYNNGESSGNVIFALYTCVDGTPQLTFDGSARSSYQFLGKNKYLYQGSNGAMYSIFGSFALSEDGTSLNCIDYYFTHEKDETFQKILFYHNTSGKWDKSVSEEMNISDDDFWEIETSLQQQIQNIPLTPFSEYKNDSSTQTSVAATTDPDLRADWAVNQLYRFTEYDKYIADMAEERQEVLFMVKSEVKDFKVLSLFLQDMDESDKVNFDVTELYRLDKLTPDRPLLVVMTFYGDIPNNGVSYVDATGTTKRFTVQISGEDGSVKLTEF